MHLRLAIPAKPEPVSNETREECVVCREAFDLRANNVKSSAHMAETGQKVS